MQKFIANAIVANGSNHTDENNHDYQRKWPTRSFFFRLFLVVIFRLFFGRHILFIYFCGIIFYLVSILWICGKKWGKKCVVGAGGMNGIFSTLFFIFITFYLQLSLLSIFYHCISHLHLHFHSPFCVELF